MYGGEMETTNAQPAPFDDVDPALVLKDFCVFHRVGNAYLANAQPPKQVELQNWRPVNSFYGFLRSWMCLLPSLRVHDADVDGHIVRYWEVGARHRPAVVLLHGFSASKENWINILYSLSGRYRLFIPDIPGFGESSFKPNADYSMRTQAERMVAWFATLGVKQAHWVGSSMGGLIAGIVSALETSIVSSLTLMASAGVVGETLSVFEQRLLEGKNGLIPETPQQVRDVLRLTTHHGQMFHTLMLGPLVARDQISRAPVYHHLFREMITPGEEASPYWACFVQAPTLIIWGDRDQVLHPCEADIFERLIPGSQKIILNGVGHLPMLERPLTSTKLLQTFWKSLD